MTTPKEVKAWNEKMAAHIVKEDELKTLVNNKGLVFLEAKPNRYGDSYIFLARSDNRYPNGQQQYITGSVGAHDVRESLERGYIVWHNGHYLHGIVEATEDYNERN